MKNQNLHLRMYTIHFKKKTCNYYPLRVSLIIILLLVVVSCSIQAQSITINPRAKIVMNGNVTLVVNDASLINNGTFAEAIGTVKFSGYADSTKSFLNGTSGTTFYNLTINKSANNVALKSSAIVRNTLNVTGGYLFTDSNLTLKSDANLTAMVTAVPTNANIYGKTNVERYIPNRRAWRLLTAPLYDANTIYNTWQNRGVYTAGKGTFVTGPNPSGFNGNGLDSSVQNQASLKYYNYTTQALTSVLNTKVPISSGSAGSADNTGYFIFIRGDRNPTNISLINNNVTTLSSTGRLQVGQQVFPAASTAGQFTLIGNPYASPVDFNLVGRTKLMKRFYVWDPKINILGGYVMLDDLDLDGNFTKSVGASMQTKEIQSGQAFFTQTSTSGAASITFTESCKSTYNNGNVFRPQSPATTSTESLRLNLYLLDTNSSIILADGILAEFNDIYSDSVNFEDAVKFTNINECLGLLRYTKTLAVERRPVITANDTLFLRLWKTTQRNYRYEFIPDNLIHPDLTAYLEDNYLHTAQIISFNSPTIVDFTIDANAASIAENRFRIVFKQTVAPLPVTYTSVKAYPKNENISVDWQVQNEINLLKYDVEKSTDGHLFSKVNTTSVIGLNNNFSQYSWLDVNPVTGTNYYRIKAYSHSGQINYSEIVKVTIGKINAAFVMVYPNPIKNNTVNIQINNQTTGNYSIQLLNSIGQVLYKSTVYYQGGNTVQTFKPNQQLPAGVYQLKITGPDNTSYPQKIIVE